MSLEIPESLNAISSPWSGKRLFAITLGYEENNDAAWLSKDPALKIMPGKAPESADDLASQPTLPV
jgi:hypothetical protein